jgi:hypothetical protein
MKRVGIKVETKIRAGEDTITREEAEARGCVKMGKKRVLCYDIGEGNGVPYQVS